MDVRAREHQVKRSRALKKSTRSGLTCQREGVDVLSVVAARHEALAKTDGVLALGYTVEDLELLLRDALSAPTRAALGTDWMRD